MAAIADRMSSLVSPPLPSPSMSSDHFRVTYVVAAADEPAARAVVDALCLEQTVELPLALVPAGTWINTNVVGKCEAIRRCARRCGRLTTSTTDDHANEAAADVDGPNDRWEALVRYSTATTGMELPQLLNVIFGNTSIKEDVMVTDLELSPSLLRCFGGPRFGIKGIREVCGLNPDGSDGPMLMTALKPMGSSVSALAEMAYRFAKGGIDIIKDDHGLANQPYAPFEERARACAEAVRRANAETGRRCVYAPCLNAPAHLVVERAKLAKAAGAGAVLMIPGITGLDSMRVLAEDPTFNLPIIAHPAILGAMLGGGSGDAVRGFSHKVLLGMLPRLAGADATIFPNFGGRFGFSVEECKGILEGCSAAMGSMPAIMPAPGGGMTMDKVNAMKDVYGNQVLLLIGGSLIGHSPDLTANARFFLGLAGRSDLYGPLESATSNETKTAMETRTAAEAGHGEGQRDADDDHGPEVALTPTASRPTAALSPEAVELASLKERYAEVEAKLARLTSMVANGNCEAATAITEAHAPGTGVVAPPTPVEGNHSKVLKRSCDGSWSWDRIDREMYKQDGGSFKGCSRYELLGKRGESPVFHVRYFEIEAGGWTTLERHRHEHAVIGIRGSGVVQLGQHVYPVSVGDVAYTAPGDTHQLRNNSSSPFGFICVVAADRDRPVEVDPTAFLASCCSAGTGASQQLHQGVREAMQAQAAHRTAMMHNDAHSDAAAGAAQMADGSACEWKPARAGAPRPKT